VALETVPTPPDGSSGAPGHTGAGHGLALLVIASPRRRAPLPCPTDLRAQPLPTAGRARSLQSTGRRPWSGSRPGGRCQVSTGWTVTSSRQQRIWDDIERFHTAEAEESVLPGRRSTLRRRRGHRAADDLAAGAAAALGWSLWRYWPRPIPRRARGYGGQRLSGAVGIELSRRDL
jgi:hypothetical protein